MYRFDYTWEQAKGPQGHLHADDAFDAAEQLLEQHPHNDSVSIRESGTARWQQHERCGRLALTNDATRRTKPKQATEAKRQAVLLTGLDCQPGQLDLFNGLDGSN